MEAFQNDLHTAFELFSIVGSIATLAAFALALFIHLEVKQVKQIADVVKVQLNGIKKDLDDVHRLDKTSS